MRHLLLRLAILFDDRILRIYYVIDITSRTLYYRKRLYIKEIVRCNFYYTYFSMLNLLDKISNSSGFVYLNGISICTVVNIFDVKAIAYVHDDIISLVDHVHDLHNTCLILCLISVAHPS